MPRRKQSNPQPVKLGAPPLDPPLVVEPSCLVLDSDFLLSGELEFGDSEIMGLGKDSVTVFSLVEDDSSVPSDPSLSFCCCKRCGKLLPDALLSTGLHLGLSLDLSSDLYCLSCESIPPSPQLSPKSSKRVQNQPDPSPSEPRLYSCALCPFTSRYSNHLTRHARIHQGRKPYQCEVCAYASTQLVNLQRHLRTHTGEKPYHCQLCTYSCSSLGNLRRHQRTHVTERKRRREEAKIGKKKKKKKKRREGDEEVASSLAVSPPGFLSLGSLDSSRLPALLFPVLCRVCGQSVEEESERGDADTDTQVCRSCSTAPSPPPAPRSCSKPSRSTLHRCPLCPFFSLYPYHLTRHLQTHDSSKPHRCPHCTYASSHPDNLKRHMRVHTGEKPFTCASCSYACGNLANLRRHERVHSGAKPFHCGVCGYSCNQSMNLKRHMLRHTGFKPYSCECGYNTGHWDNYKRHQRKHGHDTDLWDKRTYETNTDQAGGSEILDSKKNETQPS